jgi:uncharacterized membrane protein
MDRPVSAGVLVVTLAVGAGLLLVGAPMLVDGLGVSSGQQSPEADYTATHIEVHENGTATWTVRIRTGLDTNESVEEFEAFQSRFRENTSRYLGSFSEGINDTVGQASDATGRDMEAETFSASTSIETVPRRWGVVTYSFTWTRFAADAAGHLQIGDVFQGGFFIAQDDTLTITAPPGYEIADVTPDADRLDNGTARWVGQRTFTDGRPSVRFESQDSQADGPSNSDAPTDGGLTESLPFSGSMASLVLAILVLVAAAGSIAAYRWGSESTTMDEPVADEPRTDQQRVRELLAEHDGQLKQSDIVASLDWSKSKTSRVLSSMADDGDVEKLQIGRENVIRTPEDEEST